MGTSIGNRLRDARQARGVTLSHAAQRTGVREEDLRAIEQDDIPDIGLDRLRIDNLIHAYARYLDVDLRAAGAGGGNGRAARPSTAWANGEGGSPRSRVGPAPRVDDWNAAADADDRTYAAQRAPWASPTLVRPGSNGVAPGDRTNGAGVGGVRGAGADGRGLGARSLRDSTGGADDVRAAEDPANGATAGRGSLRMANGSKASAERERRRSAPMPFAVVGMLVVGSVLIGALLGVVRWRTASPEPTEAAAVLDAGSADGEPEAGAGQGGGGDAEAAGEDAGGSQTTADQGAGDDANAGAGAGANGDAAGEGGGAQADAATGDGSGAESDDDTLLEVPQNTQPPKELTMKLEFTDKVWVRVVVDGRNKLEGIMRPGAVTQFTGKRRIEVRVGVADAVEYSFNGAWYGNVSGGYDKPVDVTCTLKASCKVTKVG